MIPALYLLLALAAADPATEVRAALDAQAAGWNRGDLAAFLATYRHSEDLTFFSGGTVTKGFAAIEARYQKRYGTSAATMGHLRFEEIEIQILGRDAAFVRGRYRLQLKDSEPTGLFTLLLRKSRGRWEIVHDHTSTGN
jgi:uncharacterized protein (TIGR02246 family)